MGLVDLESGWVAGAEGEGNAAAPGADSVAGVDEEGGGWGGEEVACFVEDADSFCDGRG